MGSIFDTLTPAMFREVRTLIHMARKADLTLLVVRHAQSTANVKNILAGRIDPTPLSEVGLQEAHALTPVLSDFKPQLVLSSPLLRCRQTLARAGVADPVLDERLIEMNYGRWTGKNLKGLSITPSWRRIQKDPQNFIFPGGEGFMDAERRIRDLITEIRSGNFERIAIFTHGDIARIMINLALGRDLNAFQRINIGTASHSKLTLSREKNQSSNEAVIHYINRKEIRQSSEPSIFKVGGE